MKILTAVGQSSLAHHTTLRTVLLSLVRAIKSCAKNAKKMTVIVSGDASFVVDGAPIARGGDMTSCGAKLITSQQAFAGSDINDLIY